MSNLHQNQDMLDQQIKINYAKGHLRNLKAYQIFMWDGEISIAC